MIIKKIILVLCFSLQLAGSAGQPAKVDSSELVKSVEEMALNQTRKPESANNIFLNAVIPIKPIQDIIVGYINNWFHSKDIQDLPILFTDKNRCSLDFTQSPDGKYLAIVRMSRLGERALIKLEVYNSDLQLHNSVSWEDAVNDLRIQYSADGKYIAMFDEQKIFILDANTLKILKKIEKEFYIDSMVFMKNAENLLVALQRHPKSGLYDCAWNVEEPKLIESPFTSESFGTKNNEIGRCVLLSPDGNHIVETPGGSFVVWDYRIKKIIATHEICQYGNLKVVAYSPSGRYFAAAYPTNVDSFINIYDTKEYKLFAKIDFSDDKLADCLACAFSPNDKYLAFASGHNFYVYDIKDKKKIFKHKFKEDLWPPKLIYDPDGSTVRVLTDDSISVFDAPSSICFVDDQDQLQLVPEKALKSVRVCSNCKKDGNDINKKLKICGRCRNSWYCSIDCQRAHWPEHQLTCAQALNKSSQVSTTK